jgi:hypothetical protein
MLKQFIGVVGFLTFFPTSIAFASSCTTHFKACMAIQGPWLAAGNAMLAGDTPCKGRLPACLASGYWERGNGKAPVRADKK